MPELTIDDVDREIREAEVGVSELEQAVIDGDTTVTPEAIEKARDHVGFLRLRRKGAEKRKAEREQQERQSAHDEAIAQREAFYSTGVVPAQRAYAGLVDAIRTFQNELAAMEAEYSTIGARASELGVELPQDVRWLFDFSHYRDGDGSTYLKLATQEASGKLLAKAHGLHSDATREEYEARAAETIRLEEERQAKFMAQFTTYTEAPLRMEA